MKQKLLAFLLLGLFAVSTAFAQNRTITGKVVGSDDGLPLPGVSVRVSGGTAGTTTGADGNYSLSVSTDAKTLIFSYIGYTTRNVSIGSSGKVNVTLQVDAQQLSEVVVTGYGTQAKKEVAGAITKISGDAFQNQTIASFDKALQGRAAGVVVQANNGIPGGAISVQIRGQGSITAGNQPLYIIDGIQLNTDNNASFTQSNPLASINSNDIESIEVLKDAATASIYGAKAGNGVVIITTKRGKSGQTKFSANAYTGTQQAIKTFDILNTQEFFQLRTEARINASTTGATAATVRATQLSEMGLPATLTDAEIAALPTYDYQKEAFRTGQVRNYELTASGGGDNTQFFLSGGFNKQDAIVTKANFQRGTFRANINHQANKHLSFETGLNLSTFTQDVPFATDGSFLGSPAFAASLILPNNPIRNADGTFYGLPGSGQIFGGVLNQNIVAVNEFNSGKQTTNGLIGSAAANYKFANDFNFKSFYSLDYRLVQGKSYRDPRTPDGFNNKGLGQVQSDWNTNFLTNQTLSWNKAFSDHKIGAFTGFEYRSDVRTGISANATGFPSPEFKYLNSAAVVGGAGEFFTGYKRAGVFGRLNYSYQGKYNVSGTLRYDGSSRFGEDNKYGVFGGLSAAWNIDQEKFMDGAEWIDGLKLRASYGVTGNDEIGNFPSLGLYGGGGIYVGSPGISPTGLANPALGWESLSQYDMGVDFSLFKGRISGQVGYFIKKSDDLLLSQPLQATTGFTSITTNVGAMENKGVEVELNSINLRTAGGFQWSTNFNFTQIQNKLTRLYGGLTSLPGNPAIQVGKDINSIFSQEYAGVNPATGRPMWYDINGNVTYQPLPTDRRFIGSTNPNITGGLTNTFNYKGFDLDVLFQYQYGRRQDDGQFAFLFENGNRGFNTLREFTENRWMTPGQITSVPRAYANGAEFQGSNHAIGSTRRFRKTDYIRLKNIQFGYALPTSLISRAKITSARIYAQGSNLFTYDDYKGYDPEFFGSATGIIPNSKNITFGLQLGF